MTGMYPHKKRRRYKEREDTHRQKSHAWSDAVTSQGMPRIAGRHEKLERGKEGFFPRAFRGSTAMKE